MALQTLPDRITPNAALLIDAAGCFAGAAILLLSSTVWSWIDLPADWRQPVIVALFGFSVLLVGASRYQHRWMIALAVLGNIAWVTAGAIALFVTGTLTGMLIIAGVMAADSVMAWFQAKALDPNSVVAGDYSG